MVDYTKATGSTGTMMIRDTGGYVEFWLKASSATFNHQLPWGMTVNGVTDNNNTFDFQATGNYQRLGRWLVDDSQTVTFRLFDSNTSGLGGPTTFAKAISRGGVPPAPDLKVVSWDQDSASMNSDSNGTGGYTVDRWQLGYGTNASTPTLFKDLDLTDGMGTVTGLSNGTRYYFWARRHNVKGWSAWSDRITFITWRKPSSPTSVAFSSIGQDRVTTKFTAVSDGGTPNLEYQLEYGTTLLAPEAAVQSYGTLLVTDLKAGEKYYFRVRARNAVGWSDWSALSFVQLRAGAYVTVDGVRKRAVPYVNVNGVWKVAEPRVKIAGLWKPTA